MRRAKLGDVYAVKVPNGYKIIQWAYQVEKYGRFIRVFEGLYTSLPDNIAELVAGPHSYITSLFVGRAYRIGLLQWLGNYPVPKEYPFPDYSITFCRSQNRQIYCIKLQKTPVLQGLPRFFKFPVTKVEQLPEEFRNVKLLHDCVSPDWLLYLFDNDFSLKTPDVFYPLVHWGKDWEKRYQVYIDIVEAALAEDLRKKQL